MRRGSTFCPVAAGMESHYHGCVYEIAHLEEIFELTEVIYDLLRRERITGGIACCQSHHERHKPARKSDSYCLIHVIIKFNISEVSLG